MREPQDSLSEVVRVAGRSGKVRAAVVSALISITGASVSLLRWSLSEPWKLDTKWSAQWTQGASDAADAKIKTIALDTRLQDSTRRLWKAIVALEYEVYCAESTNTSRATCSAIGEKDFESALEAKQSDGAQAEAIKLILKLRLRPNTPIRRGRP